MQQLALRDELDFEKEVKNTFIATLIDVQNRQKEERELKKKKKKKKRNPRGGAGTPQGTREKSLASVSLLFRGGEGRKQRTFCFLPFLFVLGPHLPHVFPPQRFSMEALSSAIQSSFRQTFGSSCSERQVIPSAEPHLHLPSVELITEHHVLCSPSCPSIFVWQYLTTVIPYEKKGRPPSLGDLQILTRSRSPHTVRTPSGSDRSTHDCLLPFSSPGDERRQ